MAAVFISREGNIITRMSKDVKTDTKQYYNDTQISYNLFWMNKKNLAMHYGFWDKNTKKLHDALINENEVFADKLEIKKGDTVLDAGCGVGGSAIWIAEKYGAKVTGITVVDKQVKQATKNAKNRNVDNRVNFEAMDYCKTNFPDEAFDKIYAMESSCYAPDKQVFLKEMNRLLKPGGKLLLADVFSESGNMSNRDKVELDDWLKGWAVPNLPDLKTFHFSLRDTGFRKISDENMKDKIMPSSKRIYKIGRIFYPFDRFCNKIGLVSDTTFKSTIALVVQYRLFSDEVMQYHLIMAQKE